MLEKQVAELKRDYAELLKRFEALERKLSGRRREPPAFVKQNTLPDEPKPLGRPEGHEGAGRETPRDIHERVELASVGSCPDCGSTVRVKSTRTRVVTRLVPGRLENVEYSIPQCFCKKCNKSVEPVVPNALPNSRFDLTLLIWVACLRTLGVSVDKARFLLRTDYGLHVSSATITNNVRKLAGFLGEDYEELRAELLKEKQVHGDETSWRVKGKNWWLWEFISKRTAYFTVRNTRGHSVPEQVLGGYEGLFTADFWNAYNVLSCEKQRCWVHLQRELDKVLKYEPSTEFAEFATQILTLYYWAKSERNHGKNTRMQAEERLHALLVKEYSNGDCKRLVKRLLRHEKELFTFCAFRGALKDNNVAERGIRPAVVLRKTSFGSQSAVGAQSTAVLMSFFQTSRLQETNFTDYVQELANNRLKN
jgi:transposase